MPQVKEKPMGRVTVTVELANYYDVQQAERSSAAKKGFRRIQLEGIVDPGAARLVLPQSVVTELGLPSAGQTKVKYADDRVATRAMVKDVWLRMGGRESVFSAIVEPKRKIALIGAIVLEELDFLVNCTKQTIHPRDPKQIISEIE